MALIHHWPLQDASGTTVCDNTVDANDSVYSNSSRTVVAGPGGLYPLAQDFNGTNDTVAMAPSTAISFASGVVCSFSVWAKFAADTTQEPIMGVTGSAQHRIEATTDTNIALHASGNYTVPALGTTNWYHILVARPANNVTRLFLNGTEILPAVSLPVIWAPTHIGVRQGLRFGGLLAGLKVFNSDESANVATLFNEGKPQNSVLPTVGGTIQVGQVLTAADGTWTDGTKTRQWRVADNAGGTGAADISGQTGVNYTVAEAVGKYIGLRVTSTNGIGATVADSTWYGPITAAPSGDGMPIFDTGLRGLDFSFRF